MKGSERLNRRAGTIMHGENEEVHVHKKGTYMVAALVRGCLGGVRVRVRRLLGDKHAAVRRHADRLRGAGPPPCGELQPRAELTLPLLLQLWACVCVCACMWGCTCMCVCVYVCMCVCPSLSSDRWQIVGFACRECTSAHAHAACACSKGKSDGLRRAGRTERA